MFQAQARWLLLAGLSISALTACGEEADPGGGGTAGTPSGGGAAGSQVGGSSSGTTASGSSNGGSSAGTSMAGTSAGGMSGGSAGSSAGSGGASGGSGGDGSGGAAGPSAVANIMGGNGKTVMGTATFTQMGATTKLVIDLTACPDGMLVSHLHLMKDCSGDFTAAGGHWSPNGEQLGNYMCTAGMATHMAEKPTAMWTVGGDAATDVTKYSFMVHEGSDPAPGGRIGCGVINAK